LGFKAECLPGTGGIELAPGLTVGFGRVPADGAVETGQAGNGFGQVFNRDLETRADVDRFGAVVPFGREGYALGCVFRVDKFSGRAAVAPGDDLRCALLFGFEVLADQRRNNVRTGRVEVVARTV